MTTTSTPPVLDAGKRRLLYTVAEAMELTTLSRTVIYELMRSGRLLSVTEGRRRLIPADAIDAYIDQLRAEAAAQRDQ